MLKIKLARFGKRNQPHYRIVVTEARSKRDGAYVALLGQYAPTQTPKILNLDLDAYKEWVEKGAQPTETVAGLAKRYESGNPFPEKPKKPSKKSVEKAKAKKEAPDTPAEKATNEPQTETTEETAQAVESSEEKAE